MQNDGLIDAIEYNRQNEESADRFPPLTYQSLAQGRVATHLPEIRRLACPPVLNAITDCKQYRHCGLQNEPEFQRTFGSMDQAHQWIGKRASNHRALPPGRS